MDQRTVAQRTKDAVMPDSDGRGGPAPEERPAVIEPGFLTLEEVARYLNVSVPQVYALVRSRELPAIKIGGRGVWRVGRQQLQEYIDRLHRDTQEWAKAHPLNPRDGE